MSDPIDHTDARPPPQLIANCSKPQFTPYDRVKWIYVDRFRAERDEWAKYTKAERAQLRKAQGLDEPRPPRRPRLPMARYNDEAALSAHAVVPVRVWRKFVSCVRLWMGFS